MVTMAQVEMMLCCISMKKVGATKQKAWELMYDKQYADKKQKIVDEANKKHLTMEFLGRFVLESLYRMKLKAAA